MREKYHIPSDYMMDVIVKRFECKKNKKQSIKLSWETKYEQYPKDNINNWKKVMKQERSITALLKTHMRLQWKSKNKQCSKDMVWSVY